MHRQELMNFWWDMQSDDIRVSCEIQFTTKEAASIPGDRCYNDWRTSCRFQNSRCDNGITCTIAAERREWGKRLARQTSR